MLEVDSSSNFFKYNSSKGPLNNVLQVKALTKEEKKKLKKKKLEGFLKK